MGQRNVQKSNRAGQQDQHSGASASEADSLWLPAVAARAMLQQVGMRAVCGVLVTELVLLEVLVD